MEHGPHLVSDQRGTSGVAGKPKLKLEAGANETVLSPMFVGHRYRQSTSKEDEHEVEPFHPITFGNNESSCRKKEYVP